MSGCKTLAPILWGSCAARFFKGVTKGAILDGPATIAAVNSQWSINDLQHQLDSVEVGGRQEFSRRGRRAKVGEGKVSVVA